ncbi:hypothetical protein [Pseudomonas viridiflava]|uniref:hypothetical protein n=1 Tax=Pseudomonas viridiflava TaxID=33069 RepID=UPI00177BAD99|nr:hypothetical protein [Pseudomonas viridiflava]MBD8204778.1 hypothetical protein [Pseudomonas viridiflava]
MSGLGGGTGPYPEPVVACDQLSFIAQIASPKEDIVEQLYVGCMLDIVIGDQNGQSVVFAYWQDQEVGGIADRRLQRLRQCMNEGHMFSARVISISSGQVRVQISPI